MKTLIQSTLIALTLASPALSHATLEQQEVAPNTTYKGVMRIGHGCEGQATLKVTITIPEGVINAKPMPKPGWVLETVRGDYARTYDYHGPRSEGVQQITWSGGVLDDQHYDEFIFRARITDAFEPGSTVYFPTVQDCADGQQPWVQIPAAGQDPHDLKKPAPGLKIIAPDHAHHGH
ncbi:hypothetical protein ACMU_13665 [Actibacterium mucosum KCTC 23349]|uniref:YncI copper-binding domain-containing protein n=1 Tax=Actibacterium mucosum KCTC 23349 TaxID=1454373 RepID=A0A037ZJB9_9RHOB|nr:DUF1775 domain-containing protein [Actibacterium mucosum]KAJ55729.1 hypothetical protein ACMU_13665 [Actibacterium mucosum KCTC 23349]